MTLLTRRRASLALGTAALAAAARTQPAMGQSRAVTLRYGNAGNDQFIPNKFNVRLAQMLEQRSRGTLKTQMFMGTMGGEQRLVENMSLGLLDEYNGAYTGVREFDILYGPYFFKDAAQALRVMKGPIGAEAAGAIEKRYRAKLIGVGRLGPYVVGTKNRIGSFADLKGMKLRTPQIEGCVAAVQALGAAATPVPFTDIYLALQNGTIDGFVSALNASITSKFNEVCKYLIAPPFGEAMDKQLVSLKTWNGLSDEQRTIYQSSFDELEPTDYYGPSVTSVEADLKRWREVNGSDSVITLPGAELAMLMAPVNERLANEVFGPGAWQQVQTA